MVSDSIVKYLEAGKLNGSSISVLKYNLIEKGYDENDIDEAIYFIGNYRSENKKFHNKFLEAFRVNSAVFLRVSLGLMYLWFGIMQILNPELFFGSIPSYIGNLNFSNLEIIYFNGVFEIFLSGILLLGFFVRFSAFILAVNLYIMGLSAGDNGIMVRDLALATALLIVFLNGSDKWCLSSYLKNRE